MKICAIIPARYESSRFPGKPLAKIAGKPMIQHVYERAKNMEVLDRVIVATDDERIYDRVIEFSGNVEMTGWHSSGTDRIAEVAGELDYDLVVNIQGDEPLIKERMVEQAVEPFYSDSNLQMSTLKKKITRQPEVKNPDIVKVICNQQGEALYFSRSPLPYARSEFDNYYKHIGLYVFRREFLLKYTALDPTPLEKAESLEQLRALENGFTIQVAETSCTSTGVDRPEDITIIEEELAENETN